MYMYVLYSTLIWRSFILGFGSLQVELPILMSILSNACVHKKLPITILQQNCHNKALYSTQGCYFYIRLIKTNHF